MTEPAFSSDNPLRIGTRRSPLALAQAEMTASALRAAHGLEHGAAILVPMLASGDKIQDRPLSEIGGKALWTKELERALVDDQIDIAVHSMKDVETVRPDTFRISAMLPRADVRDRLVGAVSLEALPSGARVGTSSPRRAAQMLRLRPDIAIVPLRGNVKTRLSRIAAGECDATLLAAAGLERLGMDDVGYPLESSEWLPAASQGAVGIDCLASRAELLPFLDKINHVPTWHAVWAERHFLEALGGNCHSPVAALAIVDGDHIRLSGQIFSSDGTEMQADDIRFATGKAEGPVELAAALLDRASDKLKAMFNP